MISVQVKQFEEWRKHARTLLAQEILPCQIAWQDTDATQGSLLGETFLPPHTGVESLVSVPRAFIGLAAKVACHRDPEKWALLYSLLWRLTHGEKNLLQISTDPLVNRILLMQKAVGRDAHKMKAFVRFQLVQKEDDEIFVAWHEPDHKILTVVAPFFKERFAVQKWAIFTPDGAMAWDGNTLEFNPTPLTRIKGATRDQMELLWETYYQSTFNPARIKVKAMKREMPVRYWKNLPETKWINILLNEALQRVKVP